MNVAAEVMAIPKPHPKVHVQVEEHPYADMLANVTTKLVKTWWRFEALLEKWKRAMRADGYEDPTEDFRHSRNFHAGYGNTAGPSSDGWWLKVAATIVASAVLAATAAIYSMSARLSTLEVKVDMLLSGKINTNIGSPK